MGPSNPRILSLRINSFLDTGLGMDRGRYLQRLATDRRQPVSVAQFQDDPVLKNLLKLLATGFKGPGIRPHPPETRNRTVICSVPKELVAGPGKGSLKVIC